MNFPKNFNRPVVCLLTALLLTLGTGCQPDAPAANTPPVRYVVGLSPFYNQQQSNEAFRQLMHLLLEDMPLNSSLWIYDAYHIRTVTQLEIPNIHAFESSRTRANQFSAQVQQLKTFLASSNEQPAVAKLDFHDAIRFPQFMDFVGENLNQTNAAVITIVLGSPLYLDEKEPGFSMVDGYFPSDGHLLASRDKSVYGRRDCANSLRNVVVHFGYFGDPWASELHRQKISRFWNLFLKTQGAQLASFTGDLPTIFNAVRSGESASRTDQDELDPSQTKIEMLRITRDMGMADWITRELPANHRSPPPTTMIGPMKIGIRWQGDIDLDIYAQARPDAERLFFQHTRAPEGYFYKDQRTSPDREYEFVEFTEPVDVREVRAAVNFYEGHMPDGTRGEVRIEFQGRIYTGRFEMPAEHGNQGREGRNQEEYWTKINVMRTLGLR
ncbi:hypothetical protein GC207_06285 [bacterium]|nr:hypothetical protein [bacterium]